MAKTVPFRIGKSRIPPDWQNWDPSGLAKMVTLRIGKNRTPPDWQNWDPSGLAKLGLFRIGFSDAIEELGRVYFLSLDPSGLKLSLLFDNSL